MPPVESEQLRLRAHIKIVQAVDAWALRRGVTRAEAIRRLILHLCWYSSD
ncbi:CopG family transcriptional regulator [Aristophania vespae]|nr:CopG family transcriptional regulator [Aristophania vespae]UMM63127.1 hypothetical protein DM15PD_00810 [Aristophania vespae]